jgi:hypothetical protein
MDEYWGLRIRIFLPSRAGKTGGGGGGRVRKDSEHWESRK